MSKKQPRMQGRRSNGQQNKTKTQPTDKHKKMTKHRLRRKANGTVKEYGKEAKGRKGPGEQKRRELMQREPNRKEERSHTLNRNQRRKPRKMEKEEEGENPS